MHTIAYALKLASRTIYFTFFALIITGCSSQEKYPEAYGLYAWNGSEWIVIGNGKGKSEVELDLPMETKFLFHDKDVGLVSKNFKLVQQVFIRNLISHDISRDPGGTNMVVEPFNKWDIKDNAEIDGSFSPVKNQPEMVTWAPSSKLEVGVYAPFIEQNYQESFTVSRQAALTNVELSDSCYDKIKKFTWGLLLDKGQYKSCAGDPTEQLVQIVKKAVENVALRQSTTADIDILRIEKLIAKGANVNVLTTSAYFEIPNPILSSAVATGRTDLVELLLKKGANVNAEGSAGGHSNDAVTPLFIAVATSGVKMLQLLLENGVNPSNFNDTLLFAAKDPDVIEFLLSKGINVNAKNSMGSTVLAVEEEVRANNLKMAEDYRKSLAENPDKPGRLSENLAIVTEDLKRTEKRIKVLLKHGAKM